MGKIIHGHNKRGMRERIYQTWARMKGRCLNKKSFDYKNYGGRGITVCKEWLEYIPFYEWAMSHGYKENLTIERTDNSLGYFPDNCIFATRQEQNRNKRTPKNNKTGFTGIAWYKWTKRYVARIGFNGKQKHLGYFINRKDAIEARKKAELQYWGKN